MKLLKRWFFVFIVLVVVHLAFDLPLHIKFDPFVYLALAAGSLLGVLISTVIESGRL